MTSPALRRFRRALLASIVALLCGVSACSSGTRRNVPAKQVPKSTGGTAGATGMAGAVAMASAAGAAGAPVEDGPDRTGQPWQRTVVNFNLDWKYSKTATDGSETVALDDGNWAYVDLPHTTKFVTPEDPNALAGSYWYRKHFAVDESYHGRKVFIEFGAAMQLAEVWINGAHKVRHAGGYLPFVIDITYDLVYGGDDNLIALKVNHNAGAAWPPGKSSIDFQYHGGLYRDVKLVVTDRLYITDAVYANQVASGGVFVSYPAVSATAATVRIQTNVSNDSKVARTATVTSDLIDSQTALSVGNATGQIVLQPNTNADIVQDLVIAAPKLWHPNAPNLYRLDSQVFDSDRAVDQTSTRIGIRRIDWTRDQGLVINGARFKANGVNMHQEAYGLGNAVPNLAIYHDVKRIKDGGMDYIRGSHYPHAPAFYAACDELGILVLNAQTGWQNFADTDAFKNSTYQELREMIRRDRNHPSVVAWEASLNESEFTDAWALRTHQIVHEEYPGDQVYSAAWKWSHADIFLGASQHGIRNNTLTKPVIISEYGDWDYGQEKSTTRQARESGDVAMLTQANNVEDAKSKNMALSWFTADGFWDYADYAGFGAYGITRCGLVDMYRLPKFSYYFMQSQRDPNLVIAGVDTGPMVFIANQWTASSPSRVRVYSNCEQVSLYLNDALQATQAPDLGTSLAHPPFNFDLVAFTPGTLRAECRIGGERRATHRVSTPGVATSLSLRPESTTLLSDASDARLVFIDVVDQNGTVVPGDQSQVTLTVTGPGKIVGPTTVTMKGGQLATWLRGTRSAGAITLTATAEGLRAATTQVLGQAVLGLPPMPADRT